MKRALPVLVLVLLCFLTAGVAAGQTGPVALPAGPDASADVAGTVLAAALVFFMQAGFALLGAGLIRAKNTVSYLTKTYTSFSAGGLLYWALGFALMFGGSALAPGLARGNALIGLSGFLLAGEADHASTALLWLFQMMLAATCATIVAGAVAERLRFRAYLAYSVVVCAVIYPVYGHWIWGGGWLARLSDYVPLLGEGVGARDFAGSSAVHAVGGLVALAGAWAVGPRLGKYNRDGTPNPIPGHNMVYVAIGTFVLFCGWFGFTAGRAMAAGDPHVAVIAVNTFLAGAAGAVTAMWLTRLLGGQADITLICNGALAGLVAVTGPCAYIPSWSAVIVGVLGALVMMGSVRLVEYVLRVDDPVGAISVHGACGLLGVMCVGIFADGRYGGVSGLMAGNAGQLLAQLIACLVVAAWALGLGGLTFLALKHTIGIRATVEEELQGLDIPEHGLACYPGA